MDISNDAEGGHAWRTQPAFDPERPGLGQTETPSLEEMAKAPGGGQMLCTVAYERVGRRGGRDESPPPPPFNVWVTDAEHLAEAILKDCKRYLTSSDVDVAVDLERGIGRVYSGMQVSGSFTVHVVHEEPSR